MNEPLYNQILKVVCEYYGVRRYDVLMTKDCRINRLYNRARCVSIFFIRMLTKDAFKLINPFFGFTYPTGAQARYAHVAHLYFEDDRYKKEIDELFTIMEEKINLEVSD